ncbi:MAG: hypothetical protein U5K74_01950 [Gemmatimonadaceae bacterium]|nr:hypothetical protein [Gemmatimonadaceae bacterium]
MLTPDGRSHDSTNGAAASVFELLGGELAAVDQWTRVDFSDLDDSARVTRDAVGYRGMTMAFRVAGLTLGDADAAPWCPPFTVEIWPDRLCAQVYWHRGDASMSRIGEADAAVLHHWAAGSLTKNLRVVRFGDGDPGLEAELHLATTVTLESVREFVSAFSWDVAALHAFETESELLTTEAWVTRAALSISRSTPRIPLREHPTADWHAYETPRGVFCSLQPSGGLCESDNVLYAVRRDAVSLIPLATMPGPRNEWDYTRLTDVWLARDGASCFARSLLCEGFMATGDGIWRAIATTDPVTAIAPWGGSGFLLGLDDGHVASVDADAIVRGGERISALSGRFSHLVTVGERVIGLIETTLLGARLAHDTASATQVSEQWSLPLDTSMSFEIVSGLDVDSWSATPAIAVLGDAGITIVDAKSGVIRSRFAVELARQAKWIGPGWLLVLDTLESAGETQTRLRVLDVVSGRWTEPVVTAEVSRIAVRHDEIHVGYANQTIAVWQRAEVCRGIGAWAFRTPVPEDIVRDDEAAAKRCTRCGRNRGLLTGALNDGSAARHLVAVWNPTYATDALDAHLRVLLDWDARHRDGSAQADDVFVWWGKVKSAQRQQPMPHLAEIMAIDAQTARGDTETHLYLTDYRSLYVASVEEVIGDDPRADDDAHVPPYYAHDALRCDCWFMLADVRQLVRDDLESVAAELAKLENTRYGHRKVSLYGGMVDLPLIVTRPDGRRFFDAGERELLADGQLWAAFDAESSGVGAIEATLRDDHFGVEAWTALDSSARRFIAMAEATYRANRRDPAADLSPVLVGYGKALEAQLGRLMTTALRGAPPSITFVNVKGESKPLTSAQELGTVAHAIVDDQRRGDWLRSKLTDAEWLVSQFGFTLRDFAANGRNPASHAAVVRREDVTRWRNRLLGVGEPSPLVRLALMKPLR